MDTRTPRVTTPLSVQRQTPDRSFGAKPLPNVPKFGLWYDPRHNAQFQAFMQTGGWDALLREFAFPYIQPGDSILMRFPFSPWNRQFYWNDITRCAAETPQWYQQINEACAEARKRGFKVILYMPSPTATELLGAVSYLEHFSPSIVALDANIGAVSRVPGMAKFRQKLRDHGHQVTLEPGWDKNTPADWECPIMVQSDLYARVAAENGANWLWPWPTDGSGPEITLWHHEPIQGDLKVGMRQWCMAQKANHWSVLVEGDYFRNHGFTRADIWE